MPFDQLKYIGEYNRQNIVYRKISFNKKNQDDKAIMEWIDSQEESTSSYLKRLALEDMLRKISADSETK
jgi:hypothetical protein